eukprot:786249-Pelagomonas_calceolata.AAC.2
MEMAEILLQTTKNHQIWCSGCSGMEIRPHKGFRSEFSHPSGPTMQPCALKGQGSLFDTGCTKAEGFGAAQLAAAGSVGGSRAGQARTMLSMIGGKHGKPAPEEELTPQPQLPV